MQMEMNAFDKNESRGPCWKNRRALYASFLVSSVHQMAGLPGHICLKPTTCLDSSM